MQSPTVNDPDDIRDGRGRVAIAVGVSVALVYAAFALLVPLVVPFDEIRRLLFDLTGRWFWNLEQPFEIMRFLGGFFAGLIAGLLTTSTMSDGAVRGMVAGGLAIVLIFLAVVLVGIAEWMIVVGGMPPLAPMIVVPFVVWVLHLGLPYVIGGLVGGWLGAFWRTV